MWMGAIATVDDFKKKYEVEDARYVDEIAAFVKQHAPDTIFVYEGVNTDSGTKGTPATFEGIESYSVDRTDALVCDPHRHPVRPACCCRIPASMPQVMPCTNVPHPLPRIGRNAALFMLYSPRPSI